MNSRDESNGITPDIARRELARRELVRRQSQSNQPISSDQNNFNENIRQQQIKQFSNATGANRTPFNTLQDIGVGALKAGQNLGSLLGESGQILAGLFTGGYAPKTDIHEEMGLGKERPVDFQKLVGPSNPNPLIQGASQYAPGVFAGGSTLPGQVISNALYGATQEAPGERLKGASENALLASLPFGIKNLFSALKYGKNYLSPEKEARSYIESLGKNPDTGKLKTGEENIEELGNRVALGKKSSVEEALIPKRELEKTESQSKLFDEQNRSHKLIQDIHSVIGEEASTPEQYTNLQKSLKNYNSHGDVNKLGEDIEDIFHIPSLSDKQLSKLERTVDFSPLKQGNYLNLKNVDKNYSMGLQDLHEKFVSNPTFENSDNLKSALGHEKRRLQDKIYSKSYNDSDVFKLDRIKRNEEALVRDQDNFFKTLPKNKQDLYQQFKEKYAINVPKYEKSGDTIRKLAEGKAQELSVNDINNAFKNPSKDVENILKDIGPSGVHNIIYNRLASLPENKAKALANAILEARQSGGMSKYFSAKDENFARDLLKRLKYRKRVLAGASIAGTGIGLVAGISQGRKLF